MAFPADPLLFDIARSHLAVSYDLVWTGGFVTALLVDRGAWAPDPTDDVVGTIIGAGAAETSGARPLLVLPAENPSGVDHCVYWDANPIVYTGVLLGETFDTLVLFQFVTDDTDSYLIAAYNLGAQTGDGANVTINPPSVGYVKW